MKTRTVKRIVSFALTIATAVTMIAAGFITKAKADVNVFETYLDDLKITSKFVVYAESFSQRCHIDGNIAVNSLEEATEGIKAPSYYYSYVANGNGKSYSYLNGNTYLFGNNVMPGNLNGGSRFMNLNGSTNAAATIAKEMGLNTSKVAKEIAVSDMLKTIAAASSKVRKTMSTEYTGLAALNRVNTSATYNYIFATSQDIANSEFINAVDRYTSKVLKDTNKVLVIMVITDAKTATINFNNPMNGTAGYTATSGNLVWDFADFSGSVVFNATVDGVFVVPNGSVKNNAPVDGRIVAKKVEQGGGQEIHYPVGSMEWEKETTTEATTSTTEEATTTTTTEAATTTTEEVTTTTEEATTTTEVATTTTEEATTTTEEATTTTEEATTTTEEATTTTEEATTTTEEATTTTEEATTTTEEATTTTEEETTTKGGEVEADEETTTATEEPTTTSKRGEVEADEEANTGDSGMLEVYSFLMVISGFGIAGLGAVAFIKRR